MKLSATKLSPKLPWRLVLLILLLVSFHSPEARPSQTAISEGRVSVGPGELYYRVFGSGTPLLLLHGYTNAGVAWDRFVPELAKQFRVLVIDLPGHGRSDRVRPNFSHREAASDILAALEKLGIKEFSAVGHSSGGMILIHMALQQPDRLKRMVLVATSARIPESARRIGTQASFEALPKELLDALRQWHPGGEQQIRWIVEQQRRIAGDADEMNFSLTELKKISTLTLIVHPDRDQILPLELAFEMHQNISNSWLMVVPDSRHEFILREGLGSRLLSPAMLDFLTRR